MTSSLRHKVAKDLPVFGDPQACNLYLVVSSQKDCFASFFFFNFVLVRSIKGNHVQVLTRRSAFKDIATCNTTTTTKNLDDEKLSINTPRRNIVISRVYTA